MKRSSLAIILLAVMLAACANKSAVGGSAKPSGTGQSPTQTSKASADSSAGTAAGSGTDKNSSSGKTGTADSNGGTTNNQGTAAAGTQNQDGSSAKGNKKAAGGSSSNPAGTNGGTAAAKKLYRINDNYFVVPIDPKTNKKVVLLTFDDGPKQKAWISSLIATLDKHHAKAIFFEVGTNVKDHPDLLKYTYDRGETIGDHTWDHGNLKKKTQAQIDSEINKDRDLIKSTIGAYPRFFRPPYGSSNDYVHALVKKEGMVFMNWSNGSLDWDRKNFGHPDAIIANVLKQLHPGSVILMHELPTTVETLDKLLTDLAAKGYGFVDPSTIQLNPIQSQ